MPLSQRLMAPYFKTSSSSCTSGLQSTPSHTLAVNSRCTGTRRNNPPQTPHWQAWHRAVGPTAGPTSPRAPGPRAGPGRVQVGKASAALVQDCNLCKASHASLHESVTESRLGSRDSAIGQSLTAAVGPDRTAIKDPSYEYSKSSAHPLGHSGRAAAGQG
jgi:hypothetical protein